MKVTEQVDALVTLSTHPMKIPHACLAFAAATLGGAASRAAVGDTIGIFGGYLVSTVPAGLQRGRSTCKNDR